ncbi:MAG: AmmeMemoRadiSam system radical SAM enzyme [Deltaproteobacteria bacterium]|nr:AmmeMemoRadiSam system radical SAM enzyme [Deltaproteobacteria bacterium]
MTHVSQKNGNNEASPGPYLTKREFLKLCGTGFCFLCATHLLGSPETFGSQTARKGLIRIKLSPYFTQVGGGKIQCELCPRRCRVSDGERGFCRVRENRGGKYYSLVYGNPCIFYLDPIEKELLFHVLPGSTSLTLSTAGCNFQCKFCENWEISQAFPEDVYSYEIPPEIVVKKAKEMGARSITYTYAEPTVFYEYMADIAHHAKRAGLLNLIHSNGFINKEPLQNLCNVLDAAQIDLKGFSETFYRELSGGEMAPVLETLKTLKHNKVHLEITNLVIPTKNDDMSLVQEMCRWVKSELGPDTPVHFSRFYPLHKLQHLPPTPVSTLEKVRAVALSSGLEFVYIGNVPGHEAWNTYCPNCKRIVIRRTGYMIRDMHMMEGKCGYCGKPLPGIWA